MNPALLIAGFAAVAFVIYITTEPPTVTTPIRESILSPSDQLRALPGAPGSSAGEVIATGLSSSGAIKKILPGAGVAVSIGIGAVVAFAWFVASYDNWYDSFAKQLGFKNIQALLDSLKLIGRDDLVALFQWTVSKVQHPNTTKEESKERDQSWMLQVIEAYQQLGYEFPS